MTSRTASGPNKFDAPRFKLYLHSVDNGGANVAESRNMARSLVKYAGSQLPEVARQIGLTFAPTAPQLQDFAQNNPFAKPSNGGAPPIEGSRWHHSAFGH